MHQITTGLILIWISLNSAVLAQSLRTETGESKLKIEDYMSLKEAKELAIRQAKIDAIEKAFGSYIEQDIRNEVKNGQLSFDVVGNVKVKGEWIETLKEPVFEFPSHDLVTNKGRITERYVYCKIKGRIRKIEDNPVEFVALPLSKPMRNFTTERYYNGDRFYLFFKSANKGYLSIYVAFGDDAYRILPYAEMGGDYINNVPVEADVEYVFFDISENRDYFPGFPYHKVDELQLGTELEKEYNTIYVVYSKRPFTKPILSDGGNQGDLLLPKNLSKSKFDKWVRRNTIASTDFQFKKFRIEISQR